MLRRVKLSSVVAGMLVGALVAMMIPACVLDWEDRVALDEKTCEPALTCGLDCDDAPCRAECGATTSCSVSCDHGGCEVSCGNTTSCTVRCAGGGCQVDCGNATTCTLECAGGECTIGCSAAQTSCLCDGCPEVPAGVPGSPGE